MKSFPSWVLVAGAVLALVGVPALLGFMAGARVDAYSGISHPIPFRLLFVAIGVAVGGMVAWRVLAPRRPT